MEARTGLEPVHGAFAELCLTNLAIPPHDTRPPVASALGCFTSKPSL